jgi:SAM-dependent methyltransferase
VKDALLRWLACPECRQSPVVHAFESVVEPSGARDIEQGVFLCRCGAAYPVVDGVPRMLEGALFANEAFRSRWARQLQEVGADSERALRPPSSEFRRLVHPTLRRFGKEWQEHPLAQRTWGLEQSSRLEHALRYLGWTEEEARAKVVLDAGCGTGKLTCGMARWGGEVVGMDLAPALVRGWKQRSHWAGAAATHVSLVQGDLMRPPFLRAVFDGVHCAGVLHHTPDTRRVFLSLAALVKPGGSLGVWLYRRGRRLPRVPWLPFVRAAWASIPASVLRPATTRLSPSVLHALLVAYSGIFHAFYSAAAALRGGTHRQTVRERATSLFDSLAPPFVWHHTPDEVAGWFQAAGFVAVRETTIPGDAEGFVITGVQGLAPEEQPQELQGVIRAQ